MIFRRKLAGTSRTASPEMRARLIGGPIIGTMLSLSLPPTTATLAQLFVQLAQVHYVGLLGIEPLAALTLVAPVVQLMQLLSAADVGGAISAATARARGANDAKDLQRLVLYAVVCSLFLGLLVATIEYFGGGALYRFLGGKGRVLDEAISYGRIVFGGAVLMWMTNLLAASLRGRGETFAPSVIIIVSMLGTLPLYPMLTLGALGGPGLGLVGAAIAFVATYAVSTIALLFYMQRMGKETRISLVTHWWSWKLVRETARVAFLSSTRTILSVGAFLAATYCVGRLGDAAIAGYGIASRLDLTFVSLLHGLGISILAMVGANLGAGKAERSYRVAVVGTLMATAIGGALGLLVIVRPDVWLVHFSDDAAVLLEGEHYLRIVGLAYALGGCGSASLFVGQAMGQMRWSFWGTVGRFAIVAVCATGLFGFPDTIGSIALMMASAYAVQGIIAAAILNPANRRAAARGQVA
ncbi:MAG: MATE family efflux transporter [Reyranella sp.]|uniref:MATE family efflux transporter n=1 Tax=Reyranella sp. TaxID=1929291 RepID=UPI001ACBB4D1|nr:MATE family efflux transporter [Reyranella sp.]MBN9089763.1 MATE family efflux transporter [Reyranella sp.]